MTHISPLLATQPGGHDTDFRQLRHQTKNALQRILCQIAQCRELQASRQGQHLLEDLERRVRLSATISDALFGLVERPGPLAARLQRLCEATVDLLGDEDQLLRLAVQVEGTVPPGMADTLLRIAHELVGNAVKHGMYARSVGAITVRVTLEPRGVVRLQVIDDGWGFKDQPDAGGGLALAEGLARQHGGAAWIERRNGVTVAAATLRG